MKLDSAIQALTHHAFAKMASWADDLSGWCDHSEPICRALQAALGIRAALEEIAKEDELVASAIREVLIDDDDFEDTSRRFRYSARRVITSDDTDAARWVYHCANRTLLIAVARKKRWRAAAGEVFLSDWSIIKRVLVRHQSLRDIAEELGLDKSGSGLSGRFRDAIGAIAESVGPVEWPLSRLSPQPNPYSRGAWILARTGQRPRWRHKLHIHSGARTSSSDRGLVDGFIADGGTIQKLSAGLSVDFKGEVIGEHFTTYGEGGNFFGRYQRDRHRHGTTPMMMVVPPTRPFRDIPMPTCSARRDLKERCMPVMPRNGGAACNGSTGGNHQSRSVSPLSFTMRARTICCLANAMVTRATVDATAPVPTGIIKVCGS